MFTTAIGFPQSDALCNGAARVDTPFEMIMVSMLIMIKMIMTMTMTMMATMATMTMMTMMTTPMITFVTAE